jgi:diguanylate cyclase (GGDEF)-like protein/PAS domain S-box-containing protein
MTLSDAVTRVRQVLPAGVPLSHGAWHRRHRWMNAILLLHLMVLPVIQWVVERNFPHIALEMAPALVALGVAVHPRFGRRWRTAAATLGLVTCSSLLVHLTGGLIESHFHFFAVIAVVTLYQEWLPFVLAFVYVVVHHGVVGVLTPTAVYNHAAAWNRPVLWAMIHGAYVVLAAAANLIAWRLSEQAREGTVAVLNATGEALFGIDSEGCITFANPAMSRLTGWSIEEMEGAHHHVLLGHASGDGRTYDFTACPVCSDIEASTGENRDDHQFARRDGGRFPVEYSSHPVSGSSGADGLTAVINFQDVTDRRAFEKELARRALHDSLTGLPNRTLFVDHVLLAMSDMERYGTALAVIFCDLDRFKPINDPLGHDAGDRLLCQIAERLRLAVRPGDTVARLGGDEFVVCCPSIDATANAEQIAQRLAERLQEPFDLGVTTLNATASFGVAVTTDPQMDAAELIRRADQAMYAAKKTGGGVRAYDETMAEQLDDQLELEDQLREALVSDQLEVHYQRSAELATNPAGGVEALLRWNHPTQGVLGAATWIPLAETSGLIVPIGTWVLVQACRQIVAWNIGRATPLTVGVNAWGRQLQQPGFVERVARVLMETRCDPAWLLLEIADGKVVTATDVVTPTLAQLRAMGVQVDARPLWHQPLVLDLPPGFARVDSGVARVDLLKIGHSS